MSTEENKAIVRRFVEELWERGTLDIIDELCTPDFGWPDPVGKDFDREAIKEYVVRGRAVLSNAHLTEEETTAEGNAVVTRWTVRGTHTGEFMGIAPTGKEVTYWGIDIRHMEGGKIAEEWAIDNKRYALEQAAEPAG